MNGKSVLIVIDKLKLNKVKIYASERCNRIFANYLFLLTFHINSTPTWRLGNFASREGSIVYTT